MLVGAHYKSIPIKQASEFRDTISRSPACVVLFILPTDHRMIAMIERLQEVRNADTVVIPLTAREAHLIPIARVPQLRYYVAGKLQADALLDMQNPDGVLAFLSTHGLV